MDRIAIYPNQSATLNGRDLEWTLKDLETAGIPLTREIVSEMEGGNAWKKYTARGVYGVPGISASQFYQWLIFPTKETVRGDGRQGLGKKPRRRRHQNGDTTYLECCKCGKMRPEAEFHKAGGAIHSYCKFCMSKYRTEWRRERRKRKARKFPVGVRVS